MNEIELKDLAEERYLDISNSVLALSIERQKVLAQNQKMTLEEYQLAVLDELEDAKFEDDSEPLTLREYLDQQPIDQRYHAAGWCGRVYMGDASQLEVLQKAGYSQDAIDEIVKSQTVA